MNKGLRAVKYSACMGHGCYSTSLCQAGASQPLGGVGGTCQTPEGVSPDSASEPLRTIAFWLDHGFISPFFKF